MYLAFIDESGDPGLNAVNPEYPVFALATVVCLEREYSTRIEPQLRQFDVGVDVWGFRPVTLPTILDSRSRR